MVFGLFFFFLSCRTLFKSQREINERAAVLVEVKPVYVSVCICVCVSICGFFVCVCFRVCICECVCVSVFMNVFICICMHMHACMCVCVYSIPPYVAGYYDFLIPRREHTSGTLFAHQIGNCAWLQGWPLLLQLMPFNKEPARFIRHHPLGVALPFLGRDIPFICQLTGGTFPLYSPGPLPAAWQGRGERACHRQVLFQDSLFRTDVKK